MHKKNILKTLISLILIFIPVISFASEKNLKNVEGALVRQEWNKVSEILESVDTKTNSPVLRLIKGHADLAVNKNNESLCLFLSVISEEELKRWDKWTENFLKRHPKSAVAYYLRGDALARLEKWDKAIKVFNEGLKMEPNNVLILNARGVVYAAKGELDKARLDFYKASKKSKTPLADVYCNLGFLNIQKKDGAEGAIRHFTKALEISPDFALALHGRGLIEVVFNRFEKANEFFHTAINKEACVGILQAENLVSIQSYVTGLEKKDLVAMYSGKNPGTTFKVSMKDVLNKWKTFKTEVTEGYGPFGHFGLIQKKYNDFHTSFSQLSPEAQTMFYETYMRHDIQNNEPLKSVIPKVVWKVHTYNREGGGADIFANITGKSIEAGLRAGGIAALGARHLWAGLGLFATSAVVPEIIKGNIIQQSRMNYSGASNLLNMMKTDLPSKFPGGIHINPEEMHWDQGEWPFDAYYGLLYGLKSNTNTDLK